MTAESTMMLPGSPTVAASPIAPPQLNADPEIAREECVYLAKLAEQAERYDEMVYYMRQIAMMHKELTVEERNLVSVAYKNVIGAKRASWRIISSIEQKEEQRHNADHQHLASTYRQHVEAQLNEICQNFLSVLLDHLIPNAQNGESQVFYYKMKGDYYRYLAEFTSGEERSKVANESLQGYQKASQLAKQLLPTHAIRLGLALNFSVFYYEILNEPKTACTLAREAFDDAIRELDTLSESSYKDSTLIMQLLRDNLTLWTSDIQEPATSTATAGDGSGAASTSARADNEAATADDAQAATVTRAE